MKRIALLALIPILLALVSILPSSMIIAMANEYVGVKEGEWFKYSVTDSGTKIVWEDEILWIKLTIKEINGTLVTIQRESRDVDATAVNDTYVFDAVTGEVNSTSTILFRTADLFFLVRPNLNVNDPVYIRDGLEFLRITDILERTYFKEMEVVNSYYTITESLYDGSEPPYNYTYTQNAYWERETGVLQEWVEVGNSTEIYLETRIVLIDSYRVTSNFPTITVLLIGVAVSAVVIIVCGWKLSKRHA